MTNPAACETIPTFKQTRKTNTMTGYINWKALTQPTKDGNLPMEGNNVADYVTVASAGTSAVAPEGSVYASITCSVASTVEANVIKSLRNEVDPIYSAKELYVPAGVPTQIPNVVVGVTTITVTDV